MRLLFRVAAGPRLGFGHLVRCRSLARALGVRPRVSVRGSKPTIAAAAARGFDVVSGEFAAIGRDEMPRVLVVDDPSAREAARWVHAARELRVPVATLHDLGLGCTDSDLWVDGSVESTGRGHGLVNLTGPMFAVLDPSMAHTRERLPIDRSGVLIALGGGAHVHRWGLTLADAILSRRPDVRIRITQGFARAAGDTRHPQVTWVSAPDGLAGELAGAAVAVVGGGVTLYEAAALSTPTVAMAVTEAQQLTIRGFARRGAAVDAGIVSEPAAFAHAADAVSELISHPGRAARLGGTAAHLVDGRGVFRVADAIRQLARRSEEHFDAA